MAKKQLLTNKRAYSNFTDQRDRGLEILILRAREKIGDALRHYKKCVQHAVASTYPFLNLENIDHYTLHHLRQLEISLEWQSRLIMPTVIAVWQRLQRQSYLLSY